MRFPVIIGVVGGIGSGKMAFCKALQKHLADKYKITACILNEGLQNLSVPQNDGNEINRIMESVKADVVMVKGHSFFHDEKLRSRFDFKIFLNSDDDVRLAKFVQRNGSQNSITDAIRKYFDEVKPKYQKTLKSKEHADFVAANDMGRERMNLLGLLISDLLSKNSSQPEEELSI